MIRLLEHAAVDAAQAVGRLAGLTAVPILMYHAVDEADDDLSVSPDAFRRQLTWLRDHGFRAVSLDAYAEALCGRGLRSLGRAVVLTFDDGYLDFLEHAVPALADHGFTATVFVPTQFVGDLASWIPEPKPVMTWAQLGQCTEAGVAVEAHSVTHPHLDRIPLDEARREMAESKQAIEQHLGREVRWMCYPFGDFTPEVAAQAEQIGFAGAVSVAQGNTNRPEDLFRLRRFYIGPRTDLRHFALATSRLWTWKHRGGDRFD